MPWYIKGLDSQVLKLYVKGAPTSQLMDTVNLLWDFLGLCVIDYHGPWIN